VEKNEKATAQRHRLKQVLKRLRISREEIAGKFGTSVGYINQVLSGNNNISAGFREKLSKYYNRINVDWVMTGEGEMLNEPDGILPAGTLDPQVMEGSPVYGVGKEGVLEGLVRRVAELEAEMEVLRAALAALEEEVAALRAGGGGKEV